MEACLSDLHESSHLNCETPKPQLVSKALKSSARVGAAQTRDDDRACDSPLHRGRLPAALPGSRGRFLDPQGAGRGGHPLNRR